MSLTDRDVIRLPAVVNSAQFFALAEGDPVTWDLTGVRVLDTDSLAGLIRAARQQTVHLIVPPGAVRDKLHRAFTRHLRQVAPTEFTVDL